MPDSTSFSPSFSPSYGGLTRDSYAEVKRFILEAGDAANLLSLQERADIKGNLADVTTRTDVAIEKSFAALIKKLFPTHGFVGEENLESNRQLEYSWFIDPIDGTHYFANGVPLWSIAIALVYQNEPVLSLIYNPSTRDLYEAQKDSGTFLNGTRLSNISSKMLRTKGRFVWDYVQWKGVPSESNENVERAYRALRNDFDDHSSLVSGSLSLAFLSQGAFSAFVDPYRRKSKFVDIAAGLLMAQEVGFAVHRRSLTDVAEEVVVSRPELLKDILSVVQA
jgi:myo-inositol-1(or 4)-monophosphatase